MHIHTKIMNLYKEYELIQTQINQLEDLKKPVDRALRIRQMQILETLDDEFVKSGKESIDVDLVRIRYNSMLQYLAEKLGLPVEKYIENLKQLAQRMGISFEELNG